MFKKISGLFLLLVALLLPMNVNAKTIEEGLEDKEFIIKSIPITTEEEFYMIDEIVQNNTGYGIDNCNEDYTKCDIIKVEEGIPDIVATDVNIIYEYDKVVKTVVDSIMKKIPEGGKVFYLNDIETINYYRDLANYEPDENSPDDMLNPIKYSSEYNKFIGYKNFVFEPRMGFDEYFSSYKGGTATFEYDGTIYGAVDGIAVRVNSILYVDDDETDIVGALKKRLSKYFNIKEVSVDTEYSLDDYLEDTLEYYRDTYNSCKTIKEELDAVPMEDRNNEEYQQKNSNFYGECWFLSSYETVDDYVDEQREAILNPDEALGELNFKDRVEPYTYGITFDDDITLGFFVEKNSSKVFDSDYEVKSTDTLSGVEVSTTGIIPLDTLIQVARLTEGENYNKIIKLLDNDNVDMFDIKLFSKSADKYVTKLDDGSFEVRLPISDKFKGKDLIVYYVDNDDKVEEIPVTIDEGYAIFKTNHFSVYTLAESKTIPDDSKSVEDTKNPKTFDNIYLYIIILLVGLIGFVSGLLYLKNKKGKK